MFELTINKEIYQFNFGMGFLREIDPTVTKPIDDGVKGKVQNLGLRYAVAGIIDGDLDTLSDVLLRANKGNTPRLTQKEIDAHIEDENTDIERLFEDVLGFLKTANVTKQVTENLIETIADQKEKAAQTE
jgi:hypothetical protein